MFCSIGVKIKKHIQVYLSTMWKDLNLQILGTSQKPGITGGREDLSVVKTVLDTLIHKTSLYFFSSLSHEKKLKSSKLNKQTNKKTQVSYHLQQKSTILLRILFSRDQPETKSMVDFVFKKTMLNCIIIKAELIRSHLSLLKKLKVSPLFPFNSNDKYFNQVSLMLIYTTQYHSITTWWKTLP